MSDSRVRIFVSSPSDLDRERALVKDIVLRLGQEYLPYFELQPVLWEEEALTAAQSFQAGLLRPSECEIVLVMFWTRLGTPLADRPYGGMTGTEWEFVDAVDSSAHQGRPQVLVYKKTAPRLVDVTDAEATREAVEERHRLETFFAAHFFNPDGSFKRAFRQFDGERALRDLVEGQLRKLLNRRIGAERGNLGGGDWRNSPFRTAVPFEQGDAPVFVGRETETRELVARLERLKGEGRGLLLIAGPSGVGKSSLIRAGLLPRLARPFQFPGISACRWCLIDFAPGQAGPAPGALFERLAGALAEPGLLGGALAGFGLDGPRLARLLAAEPQVAADQVRAALDLTGIEGPTGSGEGRVQLALILDPLDGLFDAPVIAAAETQGLAAALAALAAREGIWVVAALRSDRLPELPGLPALAGQLAQDGWLALGPPPPARIRQVMEIPARVAGIEYEEGRAPGGEGLVELLESEAARLIHWPAPLQLALSELYGRAAGQAGAVRRLAVADLRELGGIAGAVLRSADALWAGLDEATRAALPRLCRATLALEGGPGARPQPREGDLRGLIGDPACRRLVGAMTEARLLVTEGQIEALPQAPCTVPEERLADALARLVRGTRKEGRPAPAPALGVLPQAGGPAGEPRADPGGATDPSAFRPIATIAHPALFERWGPIRTWLADPGNRRDLSLRVQLSRQARLWRRTDCNREYLLGEQGYAGARAFADRFEDELEPLELQYLAHSRANLVAQRRRNRAARAVGLTLALLLTVASLTAVWAWDASRRATLSLHRSLLNRADLEIGRGNTPEAVHLALESAPSLPRAAADSLSRAFASNRLVAMVQDGGPRPKTPATPDFDGPGQRLATLAPGTGARLWTLESDRFVAGPAVALPAAPLHALRFAGSGADAPLLGIGAAGVWRLPAAPGAAPDWPCPTAPGQPLALDRAGRRLALAHPASQGRFGVCVIDLTRPGQPGWDRPLHRRDIRALSFSADGRLLLTASRDGSALVLDSASGEERLALPPGGPLGRPLNDADFDPQGQRIALAAADEQIYLYDLKGRRLALLGTVERRGERLRVHRTAVRQAAFSADGRWLLAGDDEGQVVRWGLADGEAEVLGHHRLSVTGLEVTDGPDPTEGEPLVLSASLDRTARLWGQDSGREVAVFSHRAAVARVRFSTDDRRVLTDSELDGSARVWSVEPSSRLAYRLPQGGHVWHLAMAAAPPGLALGPGELLIASGSFDGSVLVRRWDPNTSGAAPAEVWRLAGHRGRVRRVAFSPTARQLASAAYDGSVRVWDLETGTGCALNLGSASGPPIEVYRALFAPDGGWLLSASNDPSRPVRLWDPAACTEIALPPALDHGQSRVQAAAVTTAPDGAQLVATGNEAGDLRAIRRGRDGRWSRLCQLAASWKPIEDLAFSPDGTTLAAVGEDGRAALVGLSEGDCGEPRYLEGGTGALYSVAFAPDGQALVTSAVDGRAQVWDLAGHRLADLHGHKDRIYNADFSPDGRWLLTASRDGTLRLWERPPPTPPAGEVPVLRSYLMLDAELGGAAYARFSPDGNAIAAAYWENAAVLWRLWSEDPSPDPALERVWGKDRSRLALIREAVRFRRDNRLDVAEDPATGD